MKRFLVDTRPEATRARVHPCAVSPQALLALLADADATCARRLAAAAAVSSLSSDMATRKDDSIQLASTSAAAARAVVVRASERTAYCARRRARSTSKCAAAELDLLLVTAKQMRLGTSSTAAQVVMCVLEGAVAGCTLSAVRPSVQVPGVVAADFSRCGQLIAGLGTVGKVVTGSVLRVVSAAGPGLKWFAPHSRNEFSVVLAQADGSAPLWLTSGDVAVTILTPTETSGDVAVTILTPTETCSAATRTSLPTAFATVLRSKLGNHGTVSVVFGGFESDVTEVRLQLAVFGTAIAGASGDDDWLVRVRRKPVAHECAALGNHVRSLAVVEGRKLGMAVSSDERWLVVGLRDEGTLSVYSLPGGVLVRRFGGEGAGPLQFNCLSRLCFAPNGHLIVVDQLNKRLQEVTLKGAFVRFIGVGLFSESRPVCVAVHDDVIAAGVGQGTGPRVVLFDFDTGAVTSWFGEFGPHLHGVPGHLAQLCTGIAFTADGSHVIVAESDAFAAKRLSLFSTGGVFVARIGMGVLDADSKDVQFAVGGQVVVTGFGSHRVLVFAPVAGCMRWELVKRFGGPGPGLVPGRFQYPSALAAAGQHLYVMDEHAGRVQVFE